CCFYSHGVKHWALCSSGGLQEALQEALILFCLVKGKESPFLHFDPSILFPKSRDYWTYEGSFTTPPCEECVTWILLREPIVVSPDQMAKLRSLSMNSENEPFRPLVDNWRPLQPLKGRIVRTSFK
uniref:carbonic anhydrase n=1 Tax=Crocodylus porosus TaxID=8502 RepID=A0A7M4FQT1_CROPO